MLGQVTACFVMLRQGYGMLRQGYDILRHVTTDVVKEVKKQKKSKA